MPPAHTTHCVPKRSSRLTVFLTGTGSSAGSGEGSDSSGSEASSSSVPGAGSDASRTGEADPLAASAG